MIRKRRMFVAALLVACVAAFVVHHDVVHLRPAGSDVAAASRAEGQPAQVIGNSIGMRLVRIEPGEFEMGAEDLSNARPVHRVRIGKPFLLGQTEVTQGQFTRVMGSTPWRGERHVREGEHVAASFVSHDAATEFCARLTQLEMTAGLLTAGQGYRLPTEAEWEYACRAGTTTQFSFGDDETLLGEYAWWGSPDHVWWSDIVGGYAHDVGLKRPNAWNLFDMHGNVAEWCSDLYARDYRATAPGEAPAGSFFFFSDRKVFRGGGWGNFPGVCRSAYRFNGVAGERLNCVGFRVACDLE